MEYGVSFKLQRLYIKINFFYKEKTLLGCRIWKLLLDYTVTIQKSSLSK